MQTAAKREVVCPALIQWILDHHHFLLFSFFTQDELENLLPYICHKFNQKVMSILIWKEMMNQLSGNMGDMGPAGRLESSQAMESTTIAPSEVPEESLVNFEDEESEDLLLSSQLLETPVSVSKAVSASVAPIRKWSDEDRGREKANAAISAAAEEEIKEKPASRGHATERIGEERKRGGGFARKKFLAEFSVPGEFQWVDLAAISRIQLLLPEAVPSKSEAEVRQWNDRIAASLRKIHSTTPESVSHFPP